MRLHPTEPRDRSPVYLYQRLTTKKQRQSTVEATPLHAPQPCAWSRFSTAVPPSGSVSESQDTDATSAKGRGPHRNDDLLEGAGAVEPQHKQLCGIAQSPRKAKVLNVAAGVAIRVVDNDRVRARQVRAKATGADLQKEQFLRASGVVEARNRTRALKHRCVLVNTAEVGLAVAEGEEICKDAEGRVRCNNGMLAHAFKHVQQRLQRLQLSGALQTDDAFRLTQDRLRNCL